MADFQLRVTAETQDAERKLRSVNDAATSASKKRILEVDADTRSADGKLQALNAKFRELEKGVDLKSLAGLGDINKNISNLSDNFKNAANNIKTFYNYAKYVPNVGEKLKTVEDTVNSVKKAAVATKELNDIAGDNGRILKGSYEIATRATESLLDRTAKVGMALFGVRQAVDLVRGAFGGLFSETIGREVTFRETILKTQTALAATSKVFKNGQEITDPYQKIVSLTGTINEHIDSIRQRSIALAGVTSNDVVEVFGLVAQQIGQIGGNLKDAEDLAISFSAALGTFGIPLYQARQEVGSILRGDITQDSYLAKSLGIRNEDIIKAKTEVGGVVKFLQDRLSAAVAGQRIAAQGFAGVTSNIKDLYELISQKFGAGLLDPLLGGLTRVFEFLFKIKDQLIGISGAQGLKGLGLAGTIGKGFGNLAGTNSTLIAGGSKVFAQAADQASPFLNKITNSISLVFASIQARINTIIGPLRKIFEEVSKSIGLVVSGLAQLAVSFALLKLAQFQAFVTAIGSVAPLLTAAANALKGFLEGNARFLQMPIVQGIVQLKTEFDLLGRVGVFNLLKIVFGLKAFIATWGAIRAGAQAASAGVINAITGMNAAFAALVRTLARVATALLNVVETFAISNAALRTQIVALKTQTIALESFAGGAGRLKQTLSELGDTIKNKLGGAITGFLRSSVQLIAFEIALTAVLDIFTRYQRAQEEAARSRDAMRSLDLLTTKYKNVTDASSSAARAAKAYAEAQVDAAYTENQSKLEEIRKKINQLTYELKPGIQSWGEFWDAASGREAGRFEQGNRQQIGRLLQEQQRIRTEQAKIDAARDKQQAKDKLRLEADNRVNLEKEITDLRKQQEDQLFQTRQQQAEKEVEIFRNAGELRIFQMEQANKKLIEGEEGASRTALEALNNYISVREHGELDIEAAKKSLAIEATNLEKQISDYRLENEKKIAEMRKRANDYEKNVSDYRRQAAGQTNPVAGITGLTQGSTGTSSTGPHFHVGGASSEAEARAIFATDISRKLTLTDVPGSARPGGRHHAGYDLAGPAGTPLNLAAGYNLTNFTRDPRGAGGNYATIAGPNNKTYTVMHLQDPGSSYKGPGSTNVAPKAPTFADLGAPAADKYAAAIRSLTSAMARLQAIQSAITSAKTKAAFDEIAQSAFKPVGLESYQDKLLELGGVLKSLAGDNYDAFNPERSQIAAEQASKLLSSQRELGQIIAGINARANLSEKEKAIAIKAVRTVHQDFVRSLQQEQQIRQQIQAITQVSDLIKRIKDETARIERENEVIRLRNRLLVEGVDPTIIEQEVARLKRAQELSDAQKALNSLTEQQTALQRDLNEARKAGDSKKVAELEKALEEARQRIKELEEALKKAQGQSAQTKPETPVGESKKPRDIISNKIGNLQRELNDLANWGNIAVKTADTIESAFGSAFQDVISGAATVKEALGGMFKKIGEMFLQMATQMIAKMLVLYALKAILGIFGGGGSPAAASAPKLTWAASGATFADGIAQFASGGSFANNIVNSPTLFRFAEGGQMNLGVLGEAGPEAILPLSRGADGKLGVQVAGTRNAMNRYSPGSYGAGAATTSESTGVTPSSAPSSPIEVRYTVERINNVEYVTSDQFQRGMQEAAAQGAVQGEQRTLRRLQNSIGTRRRIGI